MDCAPDIATTLDAWLKLYGAVSSAPTFREIAPPEDAAAGITALAALAAEALARDRCLWVITADDALLPELSNALDLRLRPLCLVLPGAEYAGQIALRATLSLLKSRLTRAAEDSDGPAWTALRARLAEDDNLWRDCLAWGQRGLDREPPPARIAEIFPVRIGPWVVAARLAAPTDWVMLLQPALLPASLRTPWPGARHTLMLASGRISGSTELVVTDAIARLRAELEVLGQELAEMELELATAQGELAVFSERYHTQIAGRIAELDALQAELARQRMASAPDDPALKAAASEADARAERSGAENARYRARNEHRETSFAPSLDLKKRFRQLAQKIHPDRARDEAERAWRTQLMSEANRAYRCGDADALDEVMALWLEGHRDSHGRDESPSHAPASKSGTEEALQRQLERIRNRLGDIGRELDQLYGSKLYELFAAARLATRQGRDLVEEMAQQFDRQIEATRASLAATDAS